MGTFMAGLGAVSGLAAVRNRPQQEMAPIDLALLGLATFKASRTIARDKLTSFVREPFVEGEANDGKGEKPTQESEMKQATRLAPVRRTRPARAISGHVAGS